MNRQANSTTAKGSRAEKMAVEYLEAQNFQILEQNFYAKKMGEIDIIAQKDTLLHFIEVKSATANFDPIYNLTPRKLKKIINASYYYMKLKNIDRAFCIDAIIIRGDEIEFIENITM